MGCRAEWSAIKGDIYVCVYICRYVFTGSSEGLGFIGLRVLCFLFGVKDLRFPPNGGH